jgi:hypothetical protein
VTDLAQSRLSRRKEAAVMGDMLQFERERGSEVSENTKATKRCWSREVKMNRAQILACKPNETVTANRMKCSGL